MNQIERNSLKIKNFFLITSSSRTKVYINYESVRYKLRQLMSNGLKNVNLFSNLVQDGHVGMPARVKENVAFAATHVTFV